MGFNSAFKRIKYILSNQYMYIRSHSLQIIAPSSLNQFKIGNKCSCYICVIELNEISPKI